LVFNPFAYFFQNFRHENLVCFLVLPVCMAAAGVLLTIPFSFVPTATISDVQFAAVKEGADATALTDSSLFPSFSPTLAVISSALVVLGLDRVFKDAVWPLIKTQISSKLMEAALNMAEKRQK
jgi:ABC-type uncharacterized transport system YnjBCD permease subunit